MISKLVLMVLAGGAALIGAVLFTRPSFTRERVVPSQQIETVSPLPIPQNIEISKPQNVLAPAPGLIASPSPVIIHITVTPTPATLTRQSTPPQSFTTPVETTAYTESGPAPSLAPIAQKLTGHIFYTSSHWKAKYYYCDTDNGWKKLSVNYLKSFNSEEELLKDYSRVLHEPCKN